MIANMYMAGRGSPMGRLTWTKVKYKNKTESKPKQVEYYWLLECLKPRREKQGTGKSEGIRID